MTLSQPPSNKAIFQQSIEKRLEIRHLREANLIVSPHAGVDVIKGLTQTAKSLPARYFYDDRASELFEQICELPEYYLTRTET